MAQPSGRQRGRPQGGALVSRERIAEVGLGLARDEGFSQVTPSRVAAVLGVTTRAVRHHVAGKEQLLQVVVEAAFRSREPTVVDPGAGWRERLEAYMQAWWNTLQAWPGLAQLTLTHPRVLAGSALVEEQARMYEVLLESGLDVEQARQFLWIFGAFVMGLMQIADTSLTDVGFFDELRFVDPAVEHVARTGGSAADLSATFAQGVKTLLDGLSAARPTDERRLGRRPRRR